NSRNAPLPAIDYADLPEARFRRYAAQVHFQQGRQMGGIASVLEGVELVLHHQRHLAQQTELIRRGDGNPASGSHQPYEFATEPTWVFEMLNSFDGSHNVSTTGRQGHSLSVQVERVKFRVFGEIIVSDHIHPDVVVEPVAHIAPQVTGATTHVQECASPR